MITIILRHRRYHWSMLWKRKALTHTAPSCRHRTPAKLNVGDVNHPDFDLGPPIRGFPQGEDDLKVIVDIVKPLIEEQAKNVILLGHSAGGWVATSAAQNLPGEITGVLYVGAFVVPPGESIHSFFQPKDGTIIEPPCMTFHKYGAGGRGTIVKPEIFLSNDLDSNEAQKQATTLIASPIPTSRLTYKNVYAGLRCAYLILDGDLTLPKEYQESMVAAQVTQSKVPFTIYHSPADHSSHLSWTKGMVEVVQNFAKTAAA